ncbi:MAG TPA: ABC transporter permease, partial [Bryobacteraceae bacterium]|nr:ABC transporter permease [Bryobacteraceae bacterium]
MATFLKDLRHAGRLLRGAPAFSTATVLILALAIGVNTAMFSIVNTWMLRPLHFANPDQLVMVLRYDTTHPEATPFFAFARDNVDWKGRIQSFQNFGGMFWRSFTLTGAGEAESFQGMVVTGDLFPTLGSQAELGRVFTSSDLSGPPVIVISHAFWERRFGGARDVLGRELALNGRSYRVIGVMPPSFSLRMENQ